MSRRDRRPPARRFAQRALLGIAAVAAASLALPLGTVAPMAATADAARSGVTVDMIPNKQLSDGDIVTITVKGPSDLFVYEARAQICRGGVSYAGSTESAPANDFRQGGANCPLVPISSSADVSVSDTATFVNAPTEEGEAFRYLIGAGKVNWTDQRAGSVQRELQCDVDHACDLVVEVQAGNPPETVPTWTPYVIPLDYAQSDPLAGCGGPAQGVLAAGGSDRMQDAWVGWTVADCKRAGQHGGATRMSFVGEGPALDMYASGGLDIAYTAGGYEPALGLSSATAPDGGRRPSVAIPIAVNAASVGVAGSYTTAGRYLPFRDVDLTLPELTAMFGGGPSALIPYLGAIGGRNAGLGQAGVLNTIGAFQVGAYPEPESPSWYMTNLFTKLSPSTWVVPDISTAGADRGQPRAASAAMALASPSFAGFIDLLTGRPTVKKSLVKYIGQTGGGGWLLADRASETAFGMAVVETPNAVGAYVAPTKESLYAGVKTMKENDEGILISDPTVTAPVDGVVPYPATMVEYALVPNEPLLNDDCSARSSSQALLTDWLTYITSPEGQALLPAGFEQLPPDLAAQASVRIAQVGSAAPTASCAGTTPPATPQGGFGGNGTGETGGFDGSDGGGVGSTSRSSSRSVTTPTVAGVEAAGAGTGATTTIAPTLSAVPAYAKPPSASPTTATLLSVIGIALLSSVAALVTSRVR
jgi:hypothetical protein